MNSRIQQCLCALLGGLFSGIFGLFCCPVYLFSGSIAVGLYVRSAPEIYISDQEAMIMGGVSGVFSGMTAIFSGWILYGSLRKIYLFFIGKRATLRLERELFDISSDFSAYMTMNIFLSILFGVAGGLICLRWVYHQHQIPTDVE